MSEEVNYESIWWPMRGPEDVSDRLLARWEEGVARSAAEAAEVGDWEKERKCREMLRAYVEERRKREEADREAARA